jgi:hypothetical protein
LVVVASLRPLPVVHASAAAMRKATLAIDDPNEVLRLTEPLLASKQYRSQALGLRTSALLQLHRCEEALQAADEVVPKFPHLAAGYFLRGTARFCLGDTAGSDADFDKATELDPASGAQAQRDWLHQQRR